MTGHSHFLPGGLALQYPKNLPALGVGLRSWKVGRDGVEGHPDGAICNLPTLVQTNKLLYWTCCVSRVGLHVGDRPC